MRSLRAIYDYVLRALPFITGKPQDAQAAIPLLQEALKLEPDYGLAHAFLAFSYHILTYRLPRENRDEAIRHARAAIAHGGATQPRLRPPPSSLHFRSMTPRLRSSFLTAHSN